MTRGLKEGAHNSDCVVLVDDYLTNQTDRHLFVCLKEEDRKRKKEEEKEEEKEKKKASEQG